MHLWCRQAHWIKTIMKKRTWQFLFSQISIAHLFIGQIFNDCLLPCNCFKSLCLPFFPPFHQFLAPLPHLPHFFFFMRKGYGPVWLALGLLPNTFVCVAKWLKFPSKKPLELLVGTLRQWVQGNNDQTEGWMRIFLCACRRRALAEPNAALCRGRKWDFWGLSISHWLMAVWGQVDAFVLWERPVRSSLW